MQGYRRLWIDQQQLWFCRISFLGHTDRGEPDDQLHVRYKRLRRSDPGDDNEGRVLTAQYPVVNNPNTGRPTGTFYNYTYDTMGRPSTMVTGPSDPDIPNMAVANGLQYNASDQTTQISYGGYNDQYTTGPISESRTYNSMNQLTLLSTSWYAYPGSGSFSETYNYTARTNNGQISSVVEGTGERVAYTYDMLKRLTNATSSVWGSQSYSYDGFGNMTSKGGSFNVLVNPATNQMTGFNYDANGNMYQGNWKYDVENRLVSVDAGGGEQYMYDPSNKRVYRCTNRAAMGRIISSTVWTAK